MLSSRLATRPRADMDKLTKARDAYDALDSELEDVENDIEGHNADLKAAQEALAESLPQQTALQTALDKAYAEYSDAWDEVGEDNLPGDFEPIAQRSAYSNKH